MRTFFSLRRAALAGAAVIVGAGALVGIGVSAANAATGTPKCLTSWLSGSLGNSDGHAGSFDFPIKFKNISNHTCHMTGYPGVSFVGAAGHQLGLPADRDHSVAVHTVTIAPGHTAYADLDVVQVFNIPSCHVVTALGLRVYPPNETRAMFIPQTFNACSNNITFSTIRPVSATAPF